MQTTWKPWQPQSLSHTCPHCGKSAEPETTFDGFNTGNYYCDNVSCVNYWQDVEATDNEELLQTI